VRLMAHARFWSRVAGVTPALRLTGATLWVHVMEAYPHAGAIVRDAPPGRTKDWNDALRQEIRQQERQDERTQERVRDQSHEHEHEHEHEPGYGRQGGRSAPGRERDDTPGH